MAESAFVSSAKFIAKDIVFDVLFFPIWWYTTGSVRVFRWMRGSIRRSSANHGLRIWFRNYFKPMYGDYSIEGRLISFGMRSVVSVGKLIAFSLWTVAAVSATVLYLVAPVVAVWFLLYQLFDVPLPVSV